MDRCSHPAREVGFEGGLIVIAGTLSLAGDFHHDIIAVFGGKEDGRGVENLLKAVAPFWLGVCLISKREWILR